MLHAVIIAGGQGTRLWPISRKQSPKQVQPFDGGDTMLQRTFARMRQFLPAENIWVETNAIYREEFLRQLPELLPDRLICEPASRNTAAAVGLAAVVLAKHDPEAVMINAWADHFVRNEEEYCQKIVAAQKVLERHPEYLVDIVAAPEYPATGFGYLEAGDELVTIDGITTHKVNRFVEKPGLATAEKYLAAGNYYWNTAIFVWRVDTLLKLYLEHVPNMHDGLMTIQAAWGTEVHDAALNRIFPELEKVAIDYAIFEKAPALALIPADLGWRDVGSWQAIYDILSEADSGIVSQGKVMAVDTHDSLIFNENPGKLVAVVGLSDIVVVDTKDALLVMRKSKDQDIKKIVSQLEETGELAHL